MTDSNGESNQLIPTTRKLPETNFSISNRQQKWAEMMVFETSRANDEND